MKWNGRGQVEVGDNRGGLELRKKDARWAFFFVVYGFLGPEEHARKQGVSNSKSVSKGKPIQFVKIRHWRRGWRGEG